MTEDSASLAQLLGAPADDPALLAFAEQPHYNICPGQNILAFRNLPARHGSLLHWGLVPAWSKDRKGSFRMINARSETVFDKPAFRKPVRAQRALVPATGFYEWKRSREPSQPYFIANADGSPMLFAGIWDRWRDDANETLLESVALLTTAAAGTVAQVHDRMPVLLERSEMDAWLDADTPEKTLRSLLSSRSEPKVALRPVSRAVNSPKNDSAALLDPVEQDPGFPSQLFP